MRTTASKVKQAESALALCHLYEKLERLAYLTGCIKEAVRISEPISGRLGRIFNEPFVYKQWEIPPQTTIAMNIREL